MYIVVRRKANEMPWKSQPRRKGKGGDLEANAMLVVASNVYCLKVNRPIVYTHNP